MRRPRADGAGAVLGREWGSVAWVTLFTSLATALVAAGWAIWKWSSEREQDRRVERERLASLYLTPFAFACEDLQSRLYNIVCAGGLSLQESDVTEERFARETLYLLARYFALEQLLLRYTPWGIDATVLRGVQLIRDDFASAGSNEDVDAWCFFRPRQRALGQLVLAPRSGDEAGSTEVVSQLEFEQSLKDKAASLNPNTAVKSLNAARTAEELPDTTRRRFVDAQSHLVDLLEHLEAELTRLKASRLPWRAKPKPVSLFVGGDTGRARARVGGIP
jgi:hypothetical protein